MQPSTAKTELFHTFAWLLIEETVPFPHEAGGWLDRKKFNPTLLSRSSPDIILGTWPASSVVINPRKGTTVGGQLPTDSSQKPTSSPTCDGQGLGGSAGGGGNNPDLEAEKKNTHC